MELEKNITVDVEMDVKITDNTLNISDRVKLTLANFVARLFPLVEVYITAQQQDITAPVLFVDFYEVNKSRKLANTSQYEYGFTISYIPNNPLSSTELNNADFIILQNITDLTGYAVQSVNSDITDSILNITGIIKVNEANVSTDPIIIKTHKEVNND